MQKKRCSHLRHFSKIRTISLFFLFSVACMDVNQSTGKQNQLHERFHISSDCLDFDSFRPHGLGGIKLSTILFTQNVKKRLISKRSWNPTSETLVR